MAHPPCPDISRMNKVHLAILWHQHQPYYKDLVTNEMLMPWVRLHGIKDYIGMIAFLDEFPCLKLNFNLVPSLMEQLEDYIAGTCTEKHLECARKNADDLDESEIKFILDNFFTANWDNMVLSHPRYGELLQQRDFERRSIDRVWRKFTRQDLRDLQVWANLSWFHPLIIDRDAFLRGLVAKDRGFTEQEKQLLLDKEIEVLARIIPEHKRLQDEGRIEVSTTPFYHPILPLLCDIRSAHEALPRLRLPDVRVSLKDDARTQLELAASYYREHFGRAPRGLWPSEGSVSPEMLPLAAGAGFTWVATDEEILARSLGVPMRRDAHQQIDRPDVLYQAYRAQAGDGKAVSMVFRDHVLSDQIGFKYQWAAPEDAANDFITRLWHIRQSLPSRDQLVAVILDGENAWEHHRNCGVDFLRALYRRICSEAWIETVTVSTHLEQRPPAVALPKVFSGSWINHSFSTWVGHPEKNAGWEYLHNTRAFLTTVKSVGSGDAAYDASWRAALAKAWKEIYVGEGSDWFWWYGDDHFSGNDEGFDSLFRKHLKNVHTLVGHTPPQYLNNAIVHVDRDGLYTVPRAFLDVVLDGKQTSYFEWAPAGHYDFRRDRGAMHKVSDNLVSDVYFGFSRDTLYMRFDPAAEPSEDRLPRIELRIWFVKDKRNELFLRVSDLALGFPKMTLEGDNLANPILLDTIAFRRVLELACPFEMLGYREGQTLEFFVEIRRNNETVQRIPENTVIAFTVPSGDFERVMWQV